MTADRSARRLAMVAGGAAVIGMVALTAAYGSDEPAPEATTPTITASWVDPVAKAPRIDPHPDPYTPTSTAPPAPTQTPGHHSLPGHH